ncbi:MAG: GyrI-like domain-containing protein [Bacteroidota bacterium]
MSHILTQSESFQIIGLKCRTTNQNIQAGKDIKQLWDDWFAKGFQAQIPHKLNENLYNIYYEYESDHNGPYSVLLGCPVSELSDIPEGLVGHAFDAQSYARYDLRGPIPKVVLDCWMEIWQGTAYQRKYAADFDLYLPGGNPPMDAIVQTYVSVK